MQKNSSYAQTLEDDTLQLVEDQTMSYFSKGHVFGDMNARTANQLVFIVNDQEFEVFSLELVEDDPPGV